MDFITEKQIYDLNKMNVASQNVQLGTLLMDLIEGGGGGGTGTTNHASLRNLDFENSNHTGFQKLISFDTEIFNFNNTTGELKLNMSTSVEASNKPITSSAVQATVGNIETLLSTI